MAAVTTAALLGAVLLSLTGSAGLRRTIDLSGALSFSVFATGAGGTPEPLGVEGRAALLSTDPPLVVASEGVTQGPLVMVETGVGVDSGAAVIAIDAGGVARRQSKILLGIPLATATPSGNSMPAHVGADLASDLGISRSCVLASTCVIDAEGHRFHVVGIVDQPAQVVLVDFDLAMERGLVDGADRVDVFTRSLPADEAARAIDAIASAGGQNVNVESEQAAAEIRSGLGRIWNLAVQAVALLVLVLSIAAQGALQLAEVNSRRRQIAMLRSIGCAPSMSLVQIICEVVISSVVGIVIAVPLVLFAASRFDLTERVAGYVPVTAGLVLVASVLAVGIGGLGAISVDPSEAFTE